MIDPKTGDQECFACGNQPPRLTTEKADTAEVDLRKKLADLEPAIRKTRVRERFGLLLLGRYEDMLNILDKSESSPLEQALWAAFLVRHLDRYFDPQVELHDQNGDYIRRVDFASTLLRIAVFTDGRTYHSSSEAQKRDAEDNRRLQEMGWVIRRYWTDDIMDNLDGVADGVYHLTAERIASIRFEP